VNLLWCAVPLRAIGISKTTMRDGALKGEVIARHAATLIQLFLSSTATPADLFPNIRKHCKHLTVLTFQDSHEMVADGLQAIALGCPKLQDVRVWCKFPPGERVMLAYANNCPAMEHLRLSTAPLTDTALLALSSNCAQLRLLAGVRWCVTSVLVCDRAAALLSRLDNFYHLMRADKYPTSKTMARTVEYAQQRA
jgi:hypothetical protein